MWLFHQAKIEQSFNILTNYIIAQGYELFLYGNSKLIELNVKFFIKLIDSLCRIYNFLIKFFTDINWVVDFWCHQTGQLFPFTRMHFIQKLFLYGKIWFGFEEILINSDKIITSLRELIYKIFKDFIDLFLNVFQSISLFLNDFDNTGDWGSKTKFMDFKALAWWCVAKYCLFLFAIFIHAYLVCLNSCYAL